MKVPTVTHRRFRDLGPPPPPFQGSGKSRRPRATSGYRPSVNLLTGPLPTDEGSGLKSLVTVTAPPESEKVVRAKRIDWILGTILGSVAALFVVALWVETTMGIIEQIAGEDLFQMGGGSFFAPALYGVHLLGIPGAALSRGGVQVGLIAIAAFWISVLGAIPLGFVVNVLIGIFAV